MSVLVKGMEMPKGCFFCPMRIKIDPDTIRCLATGNYFEETFAGTIERRNSGNCPLVEIKEPHGRLIDASTRVTTGTQRGFGLRVVTVDTLIDEHAVRNVPTIIEAEGNDT